jgi:hypothetical protein
VAPRSLLIMEVELSYRIPFLKWRGIRWTRHRSSKHWKHNVTGSPEPLRLCKAAHAEVRHQEEQAPAPKAGSGRCPQQPAGGSAWLRRSAGPRLRQRRGRSSVETAIREKLMTVEEVADRLNVSPQRVYDHATRSDPRLPLYSSGRHRTLCTGRH